MILLFGCLLLYIAALYLRPGEIIPALLGYPVVWTVAIVSGLAAVISWALEPRKLVSQPSDKWLLLLWLTMVVSNPLWGWLGGALPAFLDFLPAVVGYFLVRLAARTKLRVRVVAWVLIALNAFLAVNGLIQHVTGVGFAGVHAVDGGRVRGTGVFNDPNDLALTLVFAVPFALEELLGSAAPLLAKALLLPVIGLLWSGIFLTNSRGGMVGLAVALVSTFWGRFGAKAACAVAIAAVLAGTAVGPSRISAMDSEESSAQGRIVAWNAGLEMLKSRPLSGVGYGRFLEFHQRVAHNSFVHTFAELGILGAVAIVAIFYWFYRQATVVLRWGKTSDDKVTVLIARSLTSSVSAMLACMMFLSRQYLVIVYLPVALCACLADQAEAGQEAKTGGTFQNGFEIASLTAVGIALVYVAVRTLAVWSGA